MTLQTKKNRPIWKNCAYCKHYGRYSDMDGERTCEITKKTVKSVIFHRDTTWDRCDEFEPIRICVTCERYADCSSKLIVIKDETVNVTVFGQCDGYIVNSEIKG